MPSSARRPGLGLLAAALIATVTPTSQAAVAAGTPAPARPAMARVIAAEDGVRARALPAKPTGKQAGLISGVVHSVTGAPVGGACVTALGPSTDKSAKTWSNGRYLLSGLRPGRYRIQVRACPVRPGRARLGASLTSGPAVVTVRARQISAAAPSSLWQVGQNSLTAAGPATKHKFGGISGLVTGHGRPLAGVCAFANAVSGGPTKVVFTNKAGRYRINRLRPGRYYVVFLAALGPCHNDGNWLIQWYPGVNSPFPTRKVKLVRVRAGGITRGIDARMKLGGEISGQVRAGSGKPLSGICVNVSASFQGGYTFDYTLGTNKAGRYAARGLYHGGYQVEFSTGCGNNGNYVTQWWRGTSSLARASIIRITGVRHVTGINATLRPGATVSGVVKAVNATGKPLAGVCVLVTGADGIWHAGALTSGHGRYGITGLAAGRYQFLFDPTCNDNSNSPYEPVQRALKVGAGQRITGFDAYLPLGGGISGVVTDRRGHPVGGVCVLVNDYNEDMTRTRLNGSYSLIGLPTGSDQVMFFGGCGNSGSLAPQFYPDEPTSLFATPVRFKPNTITPNIDARMLPGGTLTGIVTDTAGHRLSRSCVSAYTAQSPVQGNVPMGVATAERGRYLIQNLAPGAYNLSFGCGGYGPQYFPSQVDPASAGLISVNAAATTRVPVARLERAGAISGKVTDVAGKPLQFGCVLVFPTRLQTTLAFEAVAFTDQHGRYRIGGLAPARYLIQFSDCTGSGLLASQWYRRQSAESAATSVRVFPGRTDAGINGVLTRGGSITGRVVGPSGRPENAICVEAFSAQAQNFVMSQTGRSGRYRVSGLSTDRWTLSFAPCSSRRPYLAGLTRPGTVRVVAPRTVTGVNVKLPTGGLVSGRVVSHSGGRPLANVCVVLLPVNPSGGFGFAYTGNNGRYVVPQLLAGKYDAYIGDPRCDAFSDAVPPFAPQWYNDQPSEAAAAAVHVSAHATTTGIDGALQPFGTVTGTVGTGAHVAVSGECVTAIPFRDPADPIFGSPAQPETAVTGRNGGYTLTALAPGRYKIEFTTGCGAAKFATQWWPHAGSAKSARVLTVGFKTISGVDATLRS